MATFLIYPIYAGAIILITIAVLPKERFRRLAIYGLVFGAIFDVAAIFLLSKLLGVAEYINYGPLAFKGIPFFPPLAWAAYYMLYFYLLPIKSRAVYGAPVVGAMFSVFFSNILQNLGIFRWNYGRILVPFLIYIVWYGFSTWAYVKLDNPEKERKMRPKGLAYRLKPAMTKRFHNIRKTSRDE